MPHSRPDGAGPSGTRITNTLFEPSQSNYSQGPIGQLTWAEWRNAGQRRQRTDASRATGEFYRQRNRPQENLPRVPRGQIHHIMEDLLTRDPMFMNGDPDIDLPNQLNFIAQGFAMGPPAGQAADNARAQAPPPTYDPPSPPRAGYTRAPKEEDILLCPNCEEELGVGKDEIKKQVWVIKKCGHV